MWNNIFFVYEVGEFVFWWVNCVWGYWFDWWVGLLWLVGLYGEVLWVGMVVGYCVVGFEFVGVWWYVGLCVY